MSKEEILKSAYESYYGSPRWDDSVQKHNTKWVYSALDMYAKQEAIAFGKWIGENSYRDCDKGWYKYYTQVKDMGNFMMSTPAYEYFTTEELYNLYIQSKKQSNG